jgi:hypothetical protein
MLTRLNALIDQLARIPDAVAHRDDLVLCGSIWLALNGIREVNDLDVLMPHGWTPSGKFRLHWGLIEEKREESDDYDDLPDEERSKFRRLVHSIETPAGKIDFFDRFICREIDPEDARASVYKHRTLKVMPLDMLIRFKRLAGRPKDIADLELLQERGMVTHVGRKIRYD